MEEVSRTDADGAIRDLVIELLGRGKMIRSRTRGKSMYPLIREGDYVIIKPIEHEEARIGDILAYKKQSGMLTAHRLLRKGSFLITKGDADLSPSHDLPISPEALLGRVLKIERDSRVIHLDSLFYRIKGYIIAYLLLKFPWLLTVLRKGRKTILAPYWVPIKILGRVINLFSKNKIHTPIF